MSTTLDCTIDHPARPSRLVPVLVGILAAAAASLLANAAIAMAVASTHPGGQEIGLTPLHYAPLTVAGVLGATAGWAWIRRGSGRPRRVLRLVVPLVVLASFVPDLLLLLVGTTPVNVAGLLGMHLAVAAITVPVLAHVLTLPGPAAGVSPAR